MKMEINSPEQLEQAEVYKQAILKARSLSFLDTYRECLICMNDCTPLHITYDDELTEALVERKYETFQILKNEWTDFVEFCKQVDICHEYIYCGFSDTVKAMIKTFN